MTRVDSQTLQVPERFQLKRVIGEGGFGTVFEAYDQEREETVALKALHQTDSRALRRFKREFRSVASLGGRHASLVTLYELFDEGHVWFFTMQLVDDGIDLFNYVRGRDYKGIEDDDSPTQERPFDFETPSGPRHICLPPSVDQIRRLRKSFRQLAEGLLFVHDGGILHRDVKPSNVLVTKAGRVLLLDFGLLSEFRDPTSADTAAIVGTPAYSSPEQLNGEPLTPSTDWFSFGVLLFQSLTMYVPASFRDGQSSNQWEGQNPPRPSDFAQGVPPDLDDLCFALLDPEADHRPSGKEVLDYFVDRAHTKTVRNDSEPTSRRKDPPFIGRARELETLRSALDAVGESAPAAVLIRGESGIGKTSLVRHFLRSVDEDVLVFAGRCFERESISYQGFDSLVDGLSDYLSGLPRNSLPYLLPHDVEALQHLFPVLKRVSDLSPTPTTLKETNAPDSQLRRRAFAALRDLLARVSSHESKAIVLFIDDLQWADSDGADLLNALVNADYLPPLLFIGCFRAEAIDDGPFLKRVHAALSDAAWPGSLVQLDVSPLSTAESRKLALALLPDGAEESAVETAAHESKGNPFFVGELAQSGPSRVADAPELASLDSLIRRRIAKLSAGARRVVSLVAVAGRPLLTSVALRSAGVHRGKQDLIVNLKAQQLLRKPSSGTDDELEIYHDRIRKSVVDALSSEELSAHHADLARELRAFLVKNPESLNHYSEPLARHFESAGDRVQATHYLETAGAHAFESLAFDRSVRLLGHALELSSDNVEQRRLRVQLGEALANAKRGREAADAFILAAEQSPTPEAVELRIRAMEQLLRSGYVEDGLRGLRTVLRELGMRLPSSRMETMGQVAWGRFRLWREGLGRRATPSREMSRDAFLRLETCWAVATGLGGVDVLLATVFHNRHALLAFEVGNTFERARALASEACYLAMGGVKSKVHAEVYIQEALAIAEQLDDPRLHGLCGLAACQTAFCVGEWERARSSGDRAKKILSSVCTGVAWELDNVDILMAFALCWRGSLREVSVKLRPLLDDVAERGDLYAETMLRVSCGGLLTLAADQSEAALQEVDYAMKRWSARGFHVQHIYATAMRAQIALYDEQPEAALEILKQADSLSARLLLSGIQVLRIQVLDLRGRCLLASAARESTGSRSSRLIREAERCASRVERELAPWGNALARVLRAGVDAARDVEKRRPELLRIARQELESNDLALHAAAIHRRTGELIGGAEGARTVREADTMMRARGVANPARWTAMLVPGMESAQN